MKKIIKLCSGLLLFSLCFFDATKTTINVNAESYSGSTFVNEFNDLSTSDISFSNGNNTKFISHGLEYYASSFGFNSTIKTFQFGRSTTANKNISEIDEFRMEYDISGYITTLSLEIGTINTNKTSSIEFKTEYSVDFGKSWTELPNSQVTLVGNETYSLHLANKYDSIRFKFIIANVNNVPGKNMVIKQLNIIGEKIYVYSIAQIIKQIDSCNCDTYLTNYDKLMELYNNLSEFEKNLLEITYTEDGVTTYKERLDYISEYCVLLNEQKQPEKDDLSFSSHNIDKSPNILIIILISGLVLILYSILVFMKR